MDEKENSRAVENGQPCFRKLIDKTTYVVTVHFSESETENFKEKIIRLLREEVKVMLT